MATSYTTLLGLALPATGELSGTWGDTVNNYISNYIDAAVAGAQTVTTDTTLTKTTGSSLGATSSQYAVIIASPASANITITAPAASKIYTIINTSGTYTVKIRGAGPTTGVTLGVNEKAQVAWNGSDFVRIGASGGPGVFSSITNTGLTSGRVVYSTTGGLETDSANLLFNGTTLTANTLNLTNALGTTYGGTGLTSFTANGVVYASSSSVLATGSALTFDGTTLAALSGGTTIIVSKGSAGNQGFVSAAGNAGVVGTSSFDMIQDATSIAYLYQRANQPMVFGVNNTEQMRLTSTGLGIGTSSPGYKLDVQGASGVGIQIYENSTGNNNRLRITQTSGITNYQLTYSTASTNAQTWTIGGSELMRLDSSGNLGIGTSSPTYNLDIYASLPQMRLNSTTGTNAAFYRAQNTGGSAFVGLENSTGSALSTGAAYSLNLYHGGAYPILFSTNAAERMRLDSSGNLGIGTSSPGAKLDALGADGAIVGLIGAATGKLRLWGYADSTRGAMVDSTNVAQNAYQPLTLNGSSILLQTGATTKATIDSSGNLGLGVTPSAWGAAWLAQDIGSYSAIANASGNTRIYHNAYTGASVDTYKNTAAAAFYGIAGGAHQWYNAPSGTAGNAITFTQAMTLDASGRLLIAGTSSSNISGQAQNLLVYSSGTNAIGGYQTAAGGYCFASYAVSNGGTYYHMVFSDAGTSHGSITSNGTTTSYNVTSDQRLKENIQDAKPAADLIDAIQVRQFDWKSDGSHQRYGFVAQELVSVAPEAVHQPADPDEMMAVDYSKLVPMLVKEIQSLRIRIAQLENKL
jgi:hypothetical protein